MSSHVNRARRSVRGDLEGEPWPTRDDHDAAGSQSGRPAAGVAPGLSDRLAAGSVRRTPRFHEVPGADQRRAYRRPTLDCRAELAAPGARAAAAATHRVARRCAGRRLAGVSVSGRARPLRAGSPADRDLVAYSQKCTHLSCAVIPRPEKGVLHCPCHEGFFDLRSGSADGRAAEPAAAAHHCSRCAARTSTPPASK